MTDDKNKKSLAEIMGLPVIQLGTETQAGLTDLPPLPEKIFGYPVVYNSFVDTPKLYPPMTVKVGNSDRFAITFGDMDDAYTVPTTLDKLEPGDSVVVTVTDNNTGEKFKIRGIVKSVDETGLTLKSYPPQNAL